jgi:hypothetical protein
MADVSKLVDELSSLTVLESAKLAKLLEARWEARKVTLADIKSDLPAWPDDVIDQWLHYFANEPDCGWPPSRAAGRSSVGQTARGSAAVVVEERHVEKGKGQVRISQLVA